MLDLVRLHFTLVDQIWERFLFENGFRLSKDGIFIDTMVRLCYVIIKLWNNVIIIITSADERLINFFLVEYLGVQRMNFPLTKKSCSLVGEFVHWLREGLRLDLTLSSSTLKSALINVIRPFTNKALSTFYILMLARSLSA